ncbi:hypothetical protein [Streptomyces sp. ME19-01-6]|uniref:hypothetical protein n=1 Tax=Streptomyces sp. ME19-01-6 TaxID=3028686 RepID=UPI0029AB7EAE|nr:hypothetical protein [Streptomyces sp. ME19-01-6]MDX3226430.1 hypothetical protein [Streptomyces sp. ME19-01-6]
MPSQEPAAEAGRRDDRTPTMRELLAACAAANAVSTPPREEPAGPVESAEDSAREGEGERRRDAA